jgi:hypothetical protein
LHVDSLTREKATDEKILRRSFAFVTFACSTTSWICMVTRALDFLLMGQMPREEFAFVLALAKLGHL